MAKVYISSVINTPADRVWAHIRDFNGLPAWHPGIADSLQAGGMLREVAAATGRRVVFFCAFGERSAMAVAAAKNAGLANTAHIEGGIDAWKKVGGPVVMG